MEDCSLMTTRAWQTQVKKNYLGYKLCLGYESMDWKHQLGQWTNNNDVHVVERVMEEIKKILPNKSHLKMKTVRILATENPKVGVLHTENGMQYTEDERGCTFHLPLEKEGYYLFLYNESVSSIKQVQVPVGCALITRHDVIIGGTGGGAWKPVPAGELSLY